jgi:outer membrane protein OmpA-like peptidoglycan-associated protein
MLITQPIAATQRFFLLCALTFWLLLAAACQAQAQTVKMYSDADRPNAQEIANILANSLRSKTRGIRLANASTLVVPDQEADAFSLPVPFAFDSAQLQPAALEQLDAVAQGFKLLDGQIVLMIEGHTDAHGKSTYNQSLSQRRADSVRKYLVEKHGIDVQLLKVEGKGANDPINRGNPFAGENRRVQFRAG